jgi:hypothetical protein
VLTNHPKIKHLPQVVYHIVAEIINKMDTTPPPISASTSTKASSKVTNLKHDAEGKITRVGGWQEAKELESMVVNGCCDGLIAAQLFSAFHTSLSKYGLNNIRKKHQKEVATWTTYGTTQTVIRVSRLSSFVVL